MARTIETVLRDMLGSLLMEQARLQAQVEDLTERVPEPVPPADATKPARTKKGQ